MIRVVSGKNGRTVGHIVGHKVETAQAQLMARESRSRAAVKALKCMHDVGDMRAETCLSARRNRGDTQCFVATCVARSLKRSRRSSCVGETGIMACVVGSWKLDSRCFGWYEIDMSDG